MFVTAEYIWLDGTMPTKQLRSKTRIVWVKDELDEVELSAFPEWGFDGSSTHQASGHQSDLVLKPAYMVPDPLRETEAYLVLCEVYNVDGTPHATNTRHFLREMMGKGGKEHEIWVGFEQEYTLFQQNEIPLGWPENGYPAPQGPYYCGVGANRVFGRELVEAHMEACLDAGLMLFGINAEVMPGQWEFQIGYRNAPEESADPLTISDQLWVARWLLERMAEDLGIVVSFAPKPKKGDWNGAGAHANFSTKQMRHPEKGLKSIQGFVEALSKVHPQHIAVYGACLEERLTGQHETCDIRTFKSGERDRGASIRIPDVVAQKGHGYIEDRRPGANCDPYLVCSKLIETWLSTY